MNLRLYRGDDESDTDNAADQDAAPREVGDTRMAIFGPHSYYVFPSYGAEFRDMSGWEKWWRKKIRGGYRFWPSSLGGGILATPPKINGKHSSAYVFDASPGCGLKEVYGMVLGNQPGADLAERVNCAIPDRQPALAVWFGAPRVPDPTVKVTAEHADYLDDERYLLVVPKAKRKLPIKMMDQLPEWFAPFGVRVNWPPTEPPDVLRDEMQGWFDNPGRRMWTVRIKGGIPNAAWQIAVVYYVAEHWDTQVRGLDSVHFVANIEGKPHFRRNWTSNR